jgi:hypothetical protein
MSDLSVHPPGAIPKPRESDCRALVPAEGPVVVHVEWDPSAALTPLGQLPFFPEYLKVSGLFDAEVEECPVSGSSNNAPNERNVLGTIVLSILRGHWRYAHISAPRGDPVNAALLGLEKVVSEDAARGTLARMEESTAHAWLQKQLLAWSPSRCSASRGFSTPMSPCSPSTVIRRGRCSAITRTSPVGPTTPTSSPICAWRWRWRCSPALSIPPSSVRRG